ncbi:MAG: peptide chain release factor N(5)-glutamine methyltransferase [Defluviitaleaceae bacterium]|nr:peptide chain release factor N(5)-glutamine methyltransferase [Defluviitaleaceae bacterium]
MTVGDAFKHGMTEVKKRDAALLLSDITGYSKTGIVLHAHKKISPDDFEKYQSHLKRRTAGEPLQYIIGKWEFMGLPLKTDKRALIPRPETELLVEEALEFINQIPRGENKIRVLDVCTGSGCIALAIACLTGDWAEITATDISEDALQLAAENAVDSSIPPGRIQFVKSNLLEEIKSGEFDVIISNPPYILSDDMPNLPALVRDYEPHIALDGGADGLDFYRRLIPECKNALRKGGALFLEIGPVEVMDLMADADFAEINLLRDYAELPRIVSGKSLCY